MEPNGRMRIDSCTHSASWKEIWLPPDVIEAWRVWKAHEHKGSEDEAHKGQTEKKSRGPEKMEKQATSA